MTQGAEAALHYLHERHRREWRDWFEEYECDVDLSPFEEEEEFVWVSKWLPTNTPAMAEEVEATTEAAAQMEMEAAEAAGSRAEGSWAESEGSACDDADALVMSLLTEWKKHSAQDLSALSQLRQSIMDAAESKEQRTPGAFCRDVEERMGRQQASTVAVLNRIARELFCEPESDAESEGEGYDSDGLGPMNDRTRSWFRERRHTWPVKVAAAHLRSIPSAAGDSSSRAEVAHGKETLQLVFAHASLHEELYSLLDELCGEDVRTDDGEDERRRARLWALRFEKPLAACRETVASIMSESLDDAARVLCVFLAFLQDHDTFERLKEWHGGAQYGEEHHAEDFVLRLMHEEVVQFDKLAVDLAFRYVRPPLDSHPCRTKSVLARYAGIAPP